MPGQNLAIKFIELNKISQKAQSAILWSDHTEREHLSLLQLIKKVINL